MTTELVTHIRQSILAVKVDDHRTDYARTFPLALAEEAANEIDRLRADLAIQAVNATAVLQAQHERDAAIEDVAKLRAGLDSFVKIAGEAFTEWDSDNDSRVGKILIALAGERPKYRADIDAIHALRRRADDVPAPLGAVLCLCDWNDDATEIVAYHPNCPAKYSAATTEKTK